MHKRLRRRPEAGGPRDEGGPPSRAGQIGFVLRILLPALACGRSLSIRNRRLAGIATAHTTTAFAHIPQSPQVWLRFAHFPPSAVPGRAKLGSFCAFSLRRPPLAGVFPSAIRITNPQSRAPGPEIGFVLHDCPSGVCHVGAANGISDCVRLVPRCAQHTHVPVAPKRQTPASKRRSPRPGSLAGWVLKPRVTLVAQLATGRDHPPWHGLVPR
jgi:hypothetical protein